MSVEARAGDDGPRWRTQLGIGIALALIALAIWLDAQRLPAPAVVGVGPSAAMKLVALLVTVLAVAHVIGAWRRRTEVLAGNAIEATSHGNRASLVWVLAALIGLIAIIQFGGGFVIASTWLFVGTSRGFGERLSIKSFAIGFALALAIYLFFTKALSLALPAGPLERLLG